MSNHSLLKSRPLFMQYIMVHFVNEGVHIYVDKANWVDHPYQNKRLNKHGL